MVEATEYLSLTFKLFTQALLLYHQRRSCDFNSKDYEKASAYFTEAIHQEPKNGLQYLDRGYCLQAMGKTDKAPAGFEKAMELEPW